MFITDETGRHEITSWRMEDAGEAPPPAPSATCQPGASAAHVVVVVDHSGSMRKSDVPGYDSRTAAVYDCLARDLVEPQLKDGGAAGMEVGYYLLAREQAGQQHYSCTAAHMHHVHSCHGCNGSTGCGLLPFTGTKPACASPHALYVSTNPRALTRLPNLPPTPKLTPHAARCSLPA